MPGFEKFEFWVSGERLRASFWEAFGDPGFTLSGIFRVPERGWNFDGHLGDQTWMTGSAFRCWTLWLNTIVSKGRRVWEEGGEKSPPMEHAWFKGDFFQEALKVWQALNFRDV